MTEGILTMSQKKLDRLEVIQRVVSKQLRQKQAAGQLVLSIRQIVLPDIGPLELRKKHLIRLLVLRTRLG